MEVGDEDGSAVQIFSDAIALGAGDDGAAGEGLTDAGAGDVSFVIGGDAEDSVFGATGLQGRTGPISPSGGSAGGGIGGEGEEDDFDILGGEEAGGFGDEGIEADVRSDAAERCFGDGGDGPTVVEGHLVHGDMHLAPCGGESGGVDEDERVEEAIAGIFEESGGDVQIGIAGDGGECVDGGAVKWLGGLAGGEESLLEPCGVVAGGVIGDETGDGEFGEENEFGAFGGGVARGGGDEVEIRGNRAGFGFRSDGGDADGLIHFFIVVMMGLQVRFPRSILEGRTSNGRIYESLHDERFRPACFAAMADGARVEHG